MNLKLNRPSDPRGGSTLGLIDGGSFSSLPPRAAAGSMLEPKPAPVDAQRNLEGPRTANARLPAVGRPRPSGGPSTVPLQQLDPRIEAYDPAALAQSGVPAFLARGARLNDLFYSFTDGGLQDSGSAAHLGGGFVVTARHVIDQFIPRDVSTHLDLPGGFAGRHVFPTGVQGWNNPTGWSVRAFPPKGGYDNSSRRVVMTPDAFGKFNDCALLQSHAHLGSSGLAGIRATKNLAPGERVFIVGDKTQGRLRLTTGEMGKIVGSNAILEACKVEAGFSGSPVLDAAGNLVGIVSIKLSGRPAASIVTTETLMALFERVGAHPPIPVIGF